MTSHQRDRLDSTSPAPWFDALRVLRPHQWVKNSLLFVPLVLAHQITDLERLTQTLLAFLGFCAFASATYVLNDLVDLEADRDHEHKRTRPLASGALSPRAGVAIGVTALALGYGLSFSLLPWICTGMLTLYLVFSTAYSLVLKERLFLDVLLLAGLYTHRVITGAVAANVPISAWLLVFSMFFFLGLAFLKRYVELRSLGHRRAKRLVRRGYEVEDIQLVQTMGLTSGFVSILVIGLYVTSTDVSRLYPNPDLLWLICPVMMYWISRNWFLARRGVLPEDPVLFAVRDRASYLAGALIAAIGAMAAL